MNRKLYIYFEMLFSSDKFKYLVTTISLFFFIIFLGVFDYTTDKYEKDSRVRTIEKLNSTNFAIIDTINYLERITMGFDGNSLTLIEVKVRYSHKVEGKDYFNEEAYGNSSEYFKFFNFLKSKSKGDTIMIRYSNKDPYNSMINYEY